MTLQITHRSKVTITDSTLMIWSSSRRFWLDILMRRSALTRFGRLDVFWFAFAGLNSLFLHGERTRNLNTRAETLRSFSDYICWLHSVTTEFLAQKLYICIAKGWSKLITEQTEYIIVFLSLSDPVEFHVESAGVADRLSFCITSPESGCGRMTVSAGQTNPSGRRLTERERQKPAGQW